MIQQIESWHVALLHHKSIQLRSLFRDLPPLYDVRSLDVAAGVSRELTYRCAPLPPDDTQFRNCIVWLEDQKIRHYKIEDRGDLRNIPSSEWPKAYQKVTPHLLLHLGSPGEWCEFS